MQKAKKFPQLSILAAGTFANVLMTILFALILWLFFVASFAPAGVNFNAYTYANIEISEITMINGVSLDNPSFEKLEELLKDATANEILVGEREFYGVRHFFEDELHVQLYDNSPAINADLRGSILSIGGEKILSLSKLIDVLNKYNPGDSVEIITISGNEEKVYQIVLDENPNKPGSTFLGVAFIPPNRNGFMGYVYTLITDIKDPFIYYEPIWDGDFPWFIYNLLWWLVLINLSVALVNMLPVGIFDGGRFFYLTVWGITGKEKLGKKAFSLTTWLMIGILFWLMLKWLLAVV
jgi:membrane-associated protease RseP (regulator of RpoE activity)